jgi:Helix-turn-helix domain/Protein of unknown function (DUF1580)
MNASIGSPRHTLRDVARLLGVHVATVWRWVLTGVRGRKLPTILVGGRRYVLAADLEAFLARSDEPARPATPRPVDDVRRDEVVDAQLDVLRI